MKPSEQVSAKLAKLRFFKSTNPEPALIKSLYLNQAGAIVAKCKKLLTLVHEKDVRKSLYAVMDQTVSLLEATAKIEDPSKKVHLELLLEASSKLRLEAIKLPAHFPMEDNLALVNYRIAVACFYLLVISVCLTLGATFGAWYFGFLTATYFTDTLVGALSAIGIPAVCLGLVSFSLHQAQSIDAEDYTTLENDICQFCDAIDSISESMEDEKTEIVGATL